MKAVNQNKKIYINNKSVDFLCEKINKIIYNLYGLCYH